MGKITMSKVSNKAISARNILVRPPEPPMNMIFNRPDASIYIARTKFFHAPFYWDYKILANPHIGVVGITGSGKSYFIKAFLTRAAFVWNSNALIIDWAGEYKSWVKQTGGKVISLGKGSYVNLLDLGGMRPYDRIKQVIRTLEILTDIGNYPEQKRLTEQAIEKSYVEAKFKMDQKEQKDELGKDLEPPTLKDVVGILEKQAALGTYEFPAELDNAIYRLKKFTKPGEDFFAQQSTVKLDELTSSGLVDLDISGLPDETSRALGALSILQFIKEKMRATGWAKEKGLRLFVVLDEAWKIAKEDNSDAVMIVREGRKYNFGLIVASQNPTDISETIFSNVGTTFILKVKYERFLDYLQGTLNFSNYMREQISKFGVGECAVNLVFYATTPYPTTFLMERIEGVEPIKDYFFDLRSVIDKKGGGFVARSVSLPREEMRKKLRVLGLNEEKVESLTKLFEKGSRHLDVVLFVILLERYNVTRNNITMFLKELGLDDVTIINIFTKADMKKSEVGGEDISQLVIEEGEEE